MAKKRIRIGLMGCGGNMRGRHLTAIVEDGAVELVAVADPSRKQADILLDRYSGDVAYYSDHRQMLRGEELDAVTISTPHATHYEQVRMALERGLHTLVEKPLTTSSRHSQNLIDLARARRRLLVVSYQRNFYAPYIFARELIAKGEIGRIRGVVAYVTQNWRGAGGWRMVPELSGGGMLIDTGSHLVASTLWMTELEPVEVVAFMDNAGKPVDINAVVNVRFEGGAVGSLNTIGNASRHDERIAIHGSDGSLVFHLHQWQVRSVLLNDEPLKIPKRIKESSPDECFFKWIRNGMKGYELPRFGVQVARLTEAAYRSHARGRVVKVAGA